MQHLLFKHYQTLLTTVNNDFQTNLLISKRDVNTAF